MNILNLKNACLIGEGRDRLCYEYPKNHDSCIKIPKRPEKQTRREKLYFKWLLYNGRS